MGFFSAIRQFLVSENPSPVPPPPAADYIIYAYRWEPGLVETPPLIPFTKQRPQIPGIYIGFPAGVDANFTDCFGRQEGSQLVYPSPLRLSNVLSKLIQDNIANFANLSPQKRLDIDGFLSYVADCLNLINRTQAGSNMLQNLCQNLQYFVLIQPSQVGNQISVSGPENSRTVITQSILDVYSRNQWSQLAEIKNFINQHYSIFPTEELRYDYLVNVINNMPLYSLFTVCDPPPVEHFLRDHLQSGGQALTGPNLQNLLSDGGTAQLDDILRSEKKVDGVKVGEYFLLALIFEFYSTDTGRGAGSGSDINFNVRRDDVNDPTHADFRPPAIGLAHELTHAMHNVRGTEPGRQFESFSTTAVELLAVGLGPFVNQLISENAIRAQWSGLRDPLPDVSNRWDNPHPRLIYDAPEEESVVQVREQYGCI